MVKRICFAQVFASFGAIVSVSMLLQGCEVRPGGLFLAQPVDQKAKTQKAKTAQVKNSSSEITLSDRDLAESHSFNHLNQTYLRYRFNDLGLTSQDLSSLNRIHLDLSDLKSVHFDTRQYSLYPFAGLGVQMQEYPIVEPATPVDALIPLVEAGDSASLLFPKRQFEDAIRTIDSSFYESYQWYLVIRVFDSTGQSPKVVNLEIPLDVGTES